MRVRGAGVKVYKLTNKDGRTRVGERNQTQWGEDVTHKAQGKGVRLCTDDVIHGSRSPYQAVVFNCIQGSYDLKTALLWECKTSEIVADDGTKVGCKELTTLRQVSLPTITTEQLVEIGIRCALEVYDNPDFIKWANAWLDGTDWSDKAAEATARAAGVAEAAARAAGAADWAAGAAAEAAGSAWTAAKAAGSVEAAARAVWSAAGVAEAAVRATSTGNKEKILAIIEQVCKVTE